ncbi:MAG: hypothetical protein AAF724_07675 [Pseudomonadota bacterium]
MPTVERATVPEDSLLHAYAAREGCYTDCFFADVHGPPDLEQYVNLFFNSRAFRFERRVLSVFGRGPVTGEAIAALASGDAQRFAIWKVENRTSSELMLAVTGAPLRTWLKVDAVAASRDRARLMFGSVSLPSPRSRADNPRPGLAYRLFVPFHLAYSRFLLNGAAADWQRGRPQPEAPE